MKQQWAVRLVYFKNPPKGFSPSPEDFSSRDEYIAAERVYIGQLNRSSARFTMLSQLIEQLRYMGHAQELGHFGIGEPHERLVIEFYAPKGTDSHEWAKINATRMRSFGFNAEPAPAWRSTAFGLEELGR